MDNINFTFFLIRRSKTQ